MMNALVRMKRVLELSEDLSSLEKTLITYAQQAHVLLYSEDTE